MKIVLFLSALLAFASCGKKANEVEKAVTQEKGETLQCGSSSANKLVPPKIYLSREIIDKVEAEFQGRPFHRATFWNILSRETRLALNLELAANFEVTEDVLYRAVVLYFENHLNAPDEDLLYRNSSIEVQIMDGSKKTNRLRVNCEDPMTSIAGIDISKVILSSTLIMDHDCKVYGTKFQLSLYDEHIVIKIGKELTSFSRAEIIRSKDSTYYKFTALNPEQRSLELSLAQSLDQLGKRRVYLRYSGLNPVSGYGTCTDRQSANVNSPWMAW